MPSKPPASLLLEWMTASAALTPTTEPVAIGVLWRDNGVLTYSVGIPPTVTGQPSDTTVVFGNSATFSVTATNATGYQWQRSNDGGGTWESVSGATSSSYSFITAAPDTAAKFLCVVTGPGGSTTSNSATLTVQGIVGSLVVDNAIPTEGATITFSHTLVGADSYQLWRGSEYIWGGESLPLSRQVGVLDSGSYTLTAKNVYGTYTTPAVTVTVAANNLVSDTFASGSPSANWSSTSGVVVSGSKMQLNGTSLGSGLSYVQRNISDNNMRFRFTVDGTGIASGQATLCTVQGAASHAIVDINLFYSGSGNLLRFTPNLDGYVYGGANRFNFNPGTGYTQVLCTTVSTVELRWDMATKSVWCYLNDVLIFAVRQAASSTFSPQAATYVRFGKVASTAYTGTVTLTNITVKQGTPAATSLGAKSRIATLLGFGQSNMNGGATGSYNSTTDAVPYSVYIQSPNDSALDGYTISTTLVTGAVSTNVLFGLSQNIKLPDGFGLCIQNAGVGSTGVTSNPGWANDGTGLYRTRCINTITDFSPIPETHTPLAMVFQGFENDQLVDDSTYQANIQMLVSSFRTAFGVSTVPIIIGGFSPAYLTGGPAQDANAIRTEGNNQAVVAADGHGAFTSTAGLTYQSGSPAWVHFDAAGYRALGARHAASYISLFPRAEP